MNERKRDGDDDVSKSEVLGFQFELDVDVASVVGGTRPAVD